MKTLLFIAAGLMAGSVMAAVDGTLVISGTVAVINELVITPNNPNRTSLNIIAGETDKNVASVFERSNSVTGYKIQMSSANASKLLHSSGNVAFSTGYTVKYDGGATVYTLTTDPQTVKISAVQGLVSDDSAVTVSVTGFGPSAAAGTYSDTITIAISNN